MTAAPKGAGAYGRLRYLARDEGVRARATAVGDVAVAFNYMGRVDGRGSAAGGDDGAAPTGPTRSPAAGAVICSRSMAASWASASCCTGATARRFTTSPPLRVSPPTAVPCSAAWPPGVSRGRARSCPRLRRTPLPRPKSPRQPHANARGSDDGGGSAEAGGAAPDDRFGVSPLQEGMLFHTLLEPHGGHYVVLMSTPLSARLDVPVFRAAWAHVIARHAILRAAFTRDGAGAATHVVAPSVTPAWEVLDWRDLPAHQRAEQLEAYLARERLRGFDPAQPPLMRFALIRMSDEEWQFIWICHHLVLDGWSRPLVLADVADAHEALASGRAPALPARRPYRDYIAWLAARDRDAAGALLDRAAAGFTEPTLLLAALAPAAAAAPGAHAGIATGYASAARALSPDTTARLLATLRGLQVTMSTAVHGAWAVLLAAYCRRADVVFGSTASGRPADLEGVEGMIGPFINTIPCRVAIEPETPVGLWLQALQARLLAHASSSTLPWSRRRPAATCRRARRSSTACSWSRITPAFRPATRRVARQRHGVDELPDHGQRDPRSVAHAGDHLRLQHRRRGRGRHARPTRLRSGRHRRERRPAAGRGAADVGGRARSPAPRLESTPAAAARKTTRRRWWRKPRGGGRPRRPCAVARASLLTAISTPRSRRWRAPSRRAAWAPPSRGRVSRSQSRASRRAARRARMRGVVCALDPAWPRERVAWHITDAGLEVCVTTARLIGRPGRRCPCARL